MATVVRQEQQTHPYSEADIGTTELLPTYRVDLRPDGKEVFFDAPQINWDDLSWKQIGRPYRVERWSQEKQRWEKEHDQELPIKTAWEMFNRSFQTLFDEDALANRRAALGDLGHGLTHFNLHEAQEALQEMVQAILLEPRPSRARRHLGPTWQARPLRGPRCRETGNPLPRRGGWL